MTGKALARRGIIEQRLPQRRRAIGKGKRQSRVVLPPQCQLESFQRIELVGGGQAKVDARHAVGGAGKVLNDGARCKRAEGLIARRAVARPPCPRPVLAGHRGRERERVRNAAHGELVRQVAKPVQVFEDEPKASHEHRILEVLAQLRNRLRNEERIVIGQRGDEGAVERKVVLRRMARPAGAAVAVEGFVEKEIAPARHERIVRFWRGRLCIAADEQDHTEDEHRQNPHAACLQRCVRGVGLEHQTGHPKDWGGTADHPAGKDAQAVIILQG